jgi:hypothetical protein
MDKFNNSNSSLALQKFYNQQNHDIRILELQQRLKTEKLMCQIEMTKFINEEKVVEEQVINEEKVIIENQIIQFDTVYQSNENFENEKPTSISVENSKPVLDQVKINNLIKLKKW